MSDVITWVRAQWDRTGGFALLTVGAVLLLSGWVGVSGTSDRAGQLSYLVSGGLGGLFCLAAGASFLLLADLDDEWRKLNELSGVLHAPGDPAIDRRGGSHTGLFLIVAASAVVLGAGWFWASGADNEDGAIPGLLLALGALVAAALVQGVTLWRARRSFSRRKTTLLDEVSTRWPVMDLPPESRQPAHEVNTVLTADGLRRYHRPGCPTMAGVDAVVVPRDRLNPDLLACQLCEAQ